MSIKTKIFITKAPIIYKYTKLNVTKFFPQKSFSFAKTQNVIQANFIDFTGSCSVIKSFLVKFNRYSTNTNLQVFGTLLWYKHFSSKKYKCIDCP